MKLKLHVEHRYQHFHRVTFVKFLSGTKVGEADGNAPAWKGLRGVALQAAAKNGCDEIIELLGNSSRPFQLLLVGRPS